MSPAVEHVHGSGLSNPPPVGGGDPAGRRCLTGMRRFLSGACRSYAREKRGVRGLPPSTFLLRFRARRRQACKKHSAAPRFGGRKRKGVSLLCGRRHRAGTFPDSARGQCLRCGVGRMRFRPFHSPLHPKGGHHRAPRPRCWWPNAPLWSAPSHRQDFLAGGYAWGWGARGEGGGKGGNLQRRVKGWKRSVQQAAAAAPCTGALRCGSRRRGESANPGGGRRQREAPVPSELRCASSRAAEA